MKCPYCGSDCKPRGLKNHVRMSGGEHGESGSVPDDFDSRIADTEAEDAENDGADSDSKPADGGADSGEDATTVSPSDFGSDDSDESDGDTDGSDGDDSLPFDPTDEDAIRLDGGEVVDIRKNGEVFPGVEADEGDYLLRTDAGPVLYDAEDDEYYEVLTA